MSAAEVLILLGVGGGLLAAGLFVVVLAAGRAAGHSDGEDHAFAEAMLSPFKRRRGDRRRGGDRRLATAPPDGVERRRGDRRANADRRRVKHVRDDVPAIPAADRRAADGLG